jgi:hypothetical protein
LRHTTTLVYISTEEILKMWRPSDYPVFGHTVVRWAPKVSFGSSFLHWWRFICGEGSSSDCTLHFRR